MSTWMLSYDPATHRRCLACGSVKGQYPLRRIEIGEEESPWPSGAPTLECGHVDSTMAEFAEMHAAWRTP
jgi:hypothetical protein